MVDALAPAALTFLAGAGAAALCLRSSLASPAAWDAQRKENATRQINTEN